MPMEKRGCVLEQRNAPSTTGYFLLGICPLIWFLRDQLSTQTWLSRVILSSLFYSGILRSPNLCEMVCDGFLLCYSLSKSLFLPCTHSDAGETEEYYYLNNSVSNPNYKHLLQDGKHPLLVNSIPLR